MLKKKQTLCKLFSFLLVLIMCSSFFQGQALATTSSTLKILEVQPGTTYDLSTNLLSGTFTNFTLDITQMPMAEFISKVDEINGQYDIVYIGNNTSGGSYTALGSAPTTLPQGGSNGSGTSKEYYSDNDITNRRANRLMEFINSKQLTIFDQSIFSSSFAGTKLYNNFAGFKNNSAYPNFVLVNTDSQKSQRIKAAFSVYKTSNLSKRPELKINSLNDQPKIYNGTDASYQSDKSLGFRFDINNQSTANNLMVKLYIDVNGDGIYKTEDNDSDKSEVVYRMDNLNSDTGYTVNYHLPDSFIGLQPWKLELTDTSTGAKSFITGATAFKGLSSGDEVNIRLLQLVPNGNTFSIYSLSNVNGQNLLYKDKVYRINVTEMTIDNFNAAYSRPTPTPATAKVNGVTTTAPTVLNGNYDMLIMGFADVYGDDDLTNANARQALKNFIATNQSVMLTHDTLTFQVNSSNTWGYNITQDFRSIVGQQRYYRTAPDSDRYYDPMPYAQKDSYGFTNLTLGRYNGSKLFQTTTKTNKINDNLVTQFPFPLGDITVAPTHFQYFQLDLEDENVVPVYTLTNSGSSTIYNHPGDGRNDYYTYTKGTITFSGTGHSKVNDDNYIEEEKMFINTVIKASRGANHAPTLEIQGISDGMNIANSSTSIDFSFTATDIDLNDQYLNADIYLSTDDGVTYQNVKSFHANDPDVSKRVKNGVNQAVNIPTPANRSGINTYKVKVVVGDNYNAQISKEITLNNVQDPQISIQNFNTSCLVGDTVTIPVTVSATATVLNETFKDIRLQGTMTKPDNTSAVAYTANLPDLVFSPESSWTNNNQLNNFSITFGTVGDYTIANKLTYAAYNGVPPNLSGMTSRENNQSFKVSVKSGTFDVEVLDMKGRGIPGVTLNIGGSRTGTTNASGLCSFTDLSSGNYTVTANVPNGRSIVGNASQTVSLSADTPYQKVSFKVSGNLITNPSITTQNEGSSIAVFKNDPLQTKLGVALNRPASFLKLDLANSLSDGSTMNVALNKVYCNGTEISFNTDSGDPLKIVPRQPNTSFPIGTYRIEATITINGSSIQAGQSFTVTLTQETSAKDASTGYVDTIDSVALPLTVNIVSGTINISVTDEDEMGIAGVTANISGSSVPVITDANGVASFVGLVGGNYTVTLVVPEGREVLESTSQTASIVANNPVQDITFTLKELPPAIPIGLTASNITQTSVILTWTTVPGATSYNVYKDGVLYASPTTNTTPVTGLTANTTYSFTVSAVNNGGESVRSAPLPVTTLPYAPATPINLTASNITQTSVTLTWTAVPGATSYNIYKDGDLYSSSATNTAPVTGLTAATLYSFTVSAANSGGESAKSNALPVTTLPNVPAIPINLTVSDITQTTAILSWTAVPGATSYNVYKDGVFYGSVTTNTTPITGLTPATFYSFTVSAVNAGGESPKATPITFKTLNGKLIFNAKITTKTGANSISILQNVPIQGVVRFELSRPVTYLKMDFTNSTVKVKLTNLYCDNKPISFTVDSNDQMKFLPNTGSLPNGTYTFDALITEANKDLIIKLKAYAQDAGDETYIDFTETETAGSFLKVNVGTAPPLH